MAFGRWVASVGGPCNALVGCAAGFSSAARAASCGRFGRGVVRVGTEDHRLLQCSTRLQGALAIGRVWAASAKSGLYA